MASPAPGPGLKANLQAQARKLGFDACRIAPPMLPAHHAERHGLWLSRGYGAGLDYLSRNPAGRYDALSLLPGCRSVVVVAHSIYTGAADQTPAALDVTPARVARYAWGEDYHNVIKDKLEHLSSWLTSQVGSAGCKTTVDTSPLSEKGYALAAGIGWRGKHSIVINAELGSYFMLGSLLTTVELAPDAPVADQCASCRRCIDACPTQAIVDPGVLNAARCIAFHNDSKLGRPEDAATLGGWLYGCDACQQACPYNATPRGTSEPRFAPRAEVNRLTAEAVLELNGGEFYKSYTGTSLARYGLEPLKHTARMLIAEAEKKPAPEGTG